MQLRYDSTPETTGNHTTINQYTVVRQINFHLAASTCTIATVVDRIKYNKLRSYTI